MHLTHTAAAFRIYQNVRAAFVDDPSLLIALEKEIALSVRDLVEGFASEAEADYNAASTMYPFWRNYPPDERGRQPRGDQYPWIEVGEHAIGTKLARAVTSKFEVSDMGFPTGADQRFVLRSPGAPVSEFRTD